jgi:hypothetical protein
MILKESIIYRGNVNIFSGDNRKILKELLNFKSKELPKLIGKKTIKELQEESELV